MTIMTSAELIRAVGEALWGALPWRAEIAATLSVGDRPLRRWAAGETEPPTGVWPELLEVVDARLAELSRVRGELARRTQSL